MSLAVHSKPTKFKTSDLTALVLQMGEITAKAGWHIMQIRESGFDVEQKSDHSPVTKADREAEAIILEKLKQMDASIPIVAEEMASEGANLWSKSDTRPDVFFLVDPLDGTKEFTSGREDFTVNIALIEQGVPIAGCVFAPAHGHLYTGGPQGAFKYEITAQDQKLAGVDKFPIATKRSGEETRIVASRSHGSSQTQAYIDRFDNADIVIIGSSLKFCILAEGKADIYPRFTPTMEWDTAAGDAVLRAAGGATFNEDGSLLVYGNRHKNVDRNFENPNFIATASRDLSTPPIGGEDSPRQG